MLGNGSDILYGGTQDDIICGTNASTTDYYYGDDGEDTLVAPAGSYGWMNGLGDYDECYPYPGSTYCDAPYAYTTCPF